MPRLLLLLLQVLRSCCALALQEGLLHSCKVCHTLMHASLLIVLLLLVLLLLLLQLLHGCCSGCLRQLLKVPNLMLSHPKAIRLLLCSCWCYSCWRCCYRQHAVGSCTACQAAAALHHVLRPACGSAGCCTSRMALLQHLLCLLL
jgi:hypothetical protein